MTPLNSSDAATEEVLLEFLNRSTAFCGQFGSGRWYCYALLVLFSLALPVGILANAAAMIDYSCVRGRPSAGRVLLLHLALCDSAWILTLPFTLHFALRRPRPADARAFCPLKRLAFNVSVYGSILFLALISFDRYVGAVHPISSRRWWRAGKARLCAACVWAALVLGAVPDLSVAFALGRPESAAVCAGRARGPPAYVAAAAVARTAAGFLLPLGIMLALYAKTACVLRRLPGGRRPLRLLAAAMLVFVVAFAPYHAVVVALAFVRPGGDALYASVEFLEAACSVGCCLDPVLYIVASEQFQRRLRALRRAGCRRLCCRAGRRVGAIG